MSADRSPRASRRPEGRLRRRRMVWAGVVLALLAGGWEVQAWFLGGDPSEELKTAAIQQLSARTGLQHLQFQYGYAWRDCAILGLGQPSDQKIDGETVWEGAHVAMIKTDGAWRIGRGTDEDNVSFDDDDLRGDHSGCLAIARSTREDVDGGVVSPSTVSAPAALPHAP